jgi:hypothetical protein
VITGAQIRAARALLSWSTVVLAKRSGVPRAVILEAEGVDGKPQIETKDLETIETTLIAGGVEMIGSIGVKFQSPKKTSLAIPVDQLNASDDG